MLELRTFDKHEVDESFLEWSKDKESRYLIQRAKSIDMLHDISTANIWIDCAMSEFIQEYLSENQIKNLREKLLEEFMDGVHLTAEQYEYLNVTSEELNKMIDKKHFQLSVNLLDSDFIQNVRLSSLNPSHWSCKVELCIADEIISEYMTVRNKLKKKRTEFLKQKSLATATKNDRFYNSRYTDAFSNEQKQRKRRLKHITKQIAEGLLLEPKRKERILKRITKLIKQSNIIKQELINQESMYGLMTHHELEKKRHPHSKLMLKKGQTKGSRRQTRAMLQASLQKFERNLLAIKKEEKRFKVDRNKVVKNINQKLFIGCYSTGPRHFSLKKGVSVKVLANSALFIQKCWRGYLARKKYGKGGRSRHALKMRKAAKQVINGRKFI